jgi:hypothetical protein
MKSVDISMTSVEVKAQTRTLKASWTREMAKDLESFSDIEGYFAKELRRENRKNSINKIFNN